MNRFETLSTVGVSLALASAAMPAAANMPPANRQPDVPAREYPGVISGDTKDICIDEAFGMNADGSLWNPANSVGEIFPNYKTKPRILRITHLFGPDVEDVCEEQVIASRVTTVTPLFQTKKGRYFRASENPVVFTQRSNPHHTGLHADDVEHPEGKNVHTLRRYIDGNILLKATTTVTIYGGTTYETSGIKVVYPDGTASVAPLPNPGLQRN